MERDRGRDIDTETEGERYGKELKGSNRGKKEREM